MQESIVRFFYRIANPVLDIFAQGITLLGEAEIIIVIALAYIWCVNKKQGFAICSSLFASITAMGVLKAIVRHPRPFQVMSDIEGKRVSTATGYSFPSGHTTTAASFYTASSMAIRKRWVSILCAVIILFVGVSRIYLGVHWPLDVVGGWILGITVSICTYRWFEKLYDDKERLVAFTLLFGSITLLASIVLLVILSLGAGDPVGMTDLMKTLAMIGGGYLGFFFDVKKINYTAQGSIKEKIIRLIPGLIGMFLIQASKAILPEAEFFGFLRYLLTGLWATAVYPWLGSKIKIGGIPLFHKEVTTA